MKSTILGLCVLIGLFLLPQTGLTQLRSEELNNLDGTWEGQVFTYMKDIAKGNPMDLQEKPIEIRIVIRSTPVEVLSKNAQGEWQSDSRPGFFDGFRFEKNAGTIVGSFLRTGRNPDQWVEHQLIYLTRKDERTVILYWLRAVNNVEIPLEKTNSKWAIFRVAELRKVSGSEGLGQRPDLKISKEGP